MNIIVAVDNQYGIGYKNKLLYNIPEDKKHFKELTLNKTIVMGRKTYESLPVKPLPHRLNIILTRNKNYVAENCIVLNNIKDFFEYTTINNIKCNDIFIIGGSGIYKTFIKYCNKIYMTKIIPTKPKTADSFFPKFEYKNIFYKSDTFDFSGGKYLFVDFEI